MFVYQMMDLLVLGSAYTPYYGDESSTLFKYNEMNASFAKSLLNLPVFIEHDTRHQIGHVVDAYINEKRQVKAILHITGNRVVNEKLPSTLYRDPANGGRRYYNSFSLGNDLTFTRNENNVLKVATNVPCEISICREGDRPMTYIDDYWILPPGVNVYDFIREKINPMINRF